MIPKILKVSQLTYQTFNTTYAHFRMSALMLQLSQQTLVPSSLIPCKTRVNPQLNYAKTEKKTGSSDQSRKERFLTLSSEKKRVKRMGKSERECLQIRYACRFRWSCDPVERAHINQSSSRCRELCHTVTQIARPGWWNAEPDRHRDGWADLHSKSRRRGSCPRWLEKLTVWETEKTGKNHLKV